MTSLGTLNELYMKAFAQAIWLRMSSADDDDEEESAVARDLVFSDESDEESAYDSESGSAAEDSDGDKEDGAGRAKKERFSARKSKALEKEALREEAAAQAELLRTNITGDADEMMDSIEEVFPDPNDELAQDPRAIHSRLQEIARILADFKKFAQKDKSRSDYMDQLVRDICAYYGYTPFLAQKLMSLFSVPEVCRLLSRIKPCLQ